MEIQEFIEKFAEIFDDTDVSEITPSTLFRDLDEWSSLSHLSVIALADVEYGVVLTAADMRAANTVEELYRLIEDKQA